MKQRPTTVAGTVPAARFLVADDSGDQAAFMRSAEWGRKAILAGWLMTMAGIVGYVYTMLRAGEETGMLRAVLESGPIGWLSAALIAAGVGVWLAGNIALMRALADEDEAARRRG